MSTRNNQDNSQTNPMWDSDRHFRAIFEHASVAMAVTSREGDFIATNRSLNMMLGREPGALDGRHFADITHPVDMAQSEEWLRALLDGETPVANWEKRYLHSDGSIVWARINVAPVVDPEEEIQHFVVQMQDITGQKRAEEAVATSEERFRLAFESAASGMALVSPTDGRFLRVNAAGCNMLGYTEAEIEGRTILEVVAPDDREESMTRFRQVANGEVASAEAKLHYLRRDGSTSYGIISTALVRDSEGKPLHLVANVVDITEQVEAQDQLRGMLDSKDQLIASVSHELRIPLTAVLGFAQLMRSELPSLSPAEQVEIVTSIADQTADLTNIVEDLLVAARADNETLKVAKVSVDLRAQSAQVVEALGENGEGGRVVLSGPSIRGMGDPARVRQVLRNLISNAFRYGGDTVEVRTYDCGPLACVAVVDDGEGIPLDDQGTIFEPYQRASNRERLAASIGLGLTVSRKLASLMDGDLTYNYEDGKSIFELSLPIAT